MSDPLAVRTPITLPWVLVLSSLLGLGLALRLHAFEFPAGFFFDEYHFVENARNYLDHKADWNDHPPLGKLIIAGSIRILGDRALAWRLPSLIAGLFTVVVSGLTVARLFRSRNAGVVAAALLASDGFLISYSRIGVLDGMLTASFALALLLTTFRWTPRLAIAAGVVLGSAANIKFSGICLALPLWVSISLDESSWARKAAWAVNLGAVGAVVYLGLYALGLEFAGQPTGVIAVVQDSQRLLQHHAGLTEMKHPYVSGWATWFLPRRAIVMARIDTLGEARVLTMLGNLATWWTAVLVSGAVLWKVLVQGFAVVRNQSTDENASPLTRFVVSHGKAVLVLGSAVFAFLAPWMLSHRDSYLYHFLPSYLALVMLLGGAVGWVRLLRPGLALGFLCVVLVVAAFYAPVWSFMPIRASAVNTRLFLEGWR